MPETLPDFSPILAALKAGDVRYVLIGGLAMVALGSAYITKDIDVSYACDPENLQRVVDALAPHHPKLRGVPADLPFFFDVLTLRNAHNITLTTDLGDLDILGDPAGVDGFEGLWERASVKEIYGLPVRVASIDDLLAMKRAANRPKDQNHILELLALRKLLQEEPDAAA